MDFRTLDLLNSGELELVDASAPSRKMVYSKEEIREMLDKGENITNIILDPSLKDLSSLFDDRVDFNQDISNWDVSNVTNMRHMFRRAASFNQDLSNWDVSSVTNMENMFCRATSFNQDLSNWDVSNVTDMRGMFWRATSFNQDISNWDMSNVADTRGMCEGSGYTFPYPKGY
jgi:surface protein